MMQLAFTEEEKSTLREEVENRLKELEVEIYHTDRSDYKMMLKHRRDVLQQILEKMPHQNGVVA